MLFIQLYLNRPMPFHIIQHSKAYVSPARLPVILQKNASPGFVLYEMNNIDLIYDFKRLQTLNCCTRRLSSPIKSIYEVRP